MKKSFDLSYYDRNYKSLVGEEILEWKRMEKDALKKGIPLSVDLRRANVREGNLFWRVDPKKDKIVLGEEKKLMINLASQKKGKVLDLGCGSGWLCLELARRGMNVVGIDVSPDRIKIAKKFLKENPFKKNFGQVRYLVADLNKIDLPKNSFDAVVDWNTLHHFPRLDNILIKVERSLKPGGKFIIFDHIGSRFLKLGSRVLKIFSSKAKEEKVVAYEDTLGKKMIDFIGEHFYIKMKKTRLCFPVSGLLFLFFNNDKLLPLLPSLIRIDKWLCNSGLFLGEYVFVEAIKREKKPLND